MIWAHPLLRNGSGAGIYSRSTLTRSFFHELIYPAAQAITTVSSARRQRMDSLEAFNNEQHDTRSNNDNIAMLHAPKTPAKKFEDASAQETGAASEVGFSSVSFRLVSEVAGGMADSPSGHFSGAGAGNEQWRWNILT